MKYSIAPSIIVFLMLAQIGCTTQNTHNQSTNTPITGPFEAGETWKSWWYDGNAEVSSFDLTQARYGELHRGEAVMVFVTEPFSSTLHVKSDRPEKDPSDITPVLKMNFARNFITGIYPYSILTSTFTPVDGNPSLKSTMSCQEWCGHVYAQLDFREKGYQHIGHSYFENEGEVNEMIPWINASERYYLEDEIWNLIRMNPDVLPEEKVMMVPPLSFLRLLHLEVKPYEAHCSLEMRKNDPQLYTITYPELNRTVRIEHEESSPFRILAWTETYKDGWSDDAPLLTTTGTLRKTVRTDYWNQHAVSDSLMRKELGF